MRTSMRGSPTAPVLGGAGSARAGCAAIAGRALTTACVAAVFASAPGGLGAGRGGAALGGGAGVARAVARVRGEAGSGSG
jgi:hypothetical protein